MSFEQSEKRAKARSKYFVRKKPLKVFRDEYCRFYGPAAKPYEEAEIADVD